MLRHTTEEVLDACTEALEPARAALTSQLRKQVMDELSKGLNNHNWFTGFDISDEPPMKFTLENWIKLAKEVQATVFIAGIQMLDQLISFFWKHLRKVLDIYGYHDFDVKFYYLY